MLNKVMNWLNDELEGGPAEGTEPDNKVVEVADEEDTEYPMLDPATVNLIAALRRSTETE